MCLFAMETTPLPFKNAQYRGFPGVTPASRGVGIEALSLERNGALLEPQRPDFLYLLLVSSSSAEL